MVFILNRQLLTFPGSHPPSIISVWELNFCVRDGNRCSLPAIVTGYFCSLFWFISASHFLARCSRTSCTLRASLVVFLDLNQNSFANLLVLTHCCVVASHRSALHWTKISAQTRFSQICFLWVPSKLNNVTSSTRFSLLPTSLNLFSFLG